MDKIFCQGNSTNSGDTSNRPDSERRPNICDDLPPSLRQIAFSIAMDDSPRRFAQSARHESTGSEHTRVHYSSRDNQERIIINDTEDFQILPEPTNAIYEPVMDDGVPHPDSQSERRARSDGLRVHYSIVNNGDGVLQIFPPPTRAISELFSNILENVVIGDSQSQGNSGSDSLNVHYSADNNGTAGRPWIWKLLTHDQCLCRIGTLLLCIVIIGFLIYVKLTMSSS
ncbi:hypothetical protein AVEN_13321-1 [Araneus ventricosus]|uniref:Uncharacterized protein n=2 Tax=Araneus ventricosus TaxID=182803 RepID=A0A4Y2TMX4_ARAVE|nr:hypothetical protein AVEN_13321-1 [Araneus ventricosus]